ncbi:hypothetical protein CVT24_011646 [Panaeolus cyanescens]|uniref:Uncharacterized protein n=1 Tax=Panaeolus cyanescens TaxID=181874 RepID=A0A409YH31_9AGAR|nr:hypothetical protein CVT24_011646 [Panaeolus cyanescens]
MHDINPEASAMGALFAEAILYGMYMVTFINVLTKIFRTECSRWKPRSQIRWETLAVGILLWMNATLNLALGLVRQMQQYIFRDLSKNPNIKQVGQDWINIAKPFSVTIQILAADGFLIYRCWVSYNRSWGIIILPSFLWLLGIGQSIWTLYIQTRLQFGDRLNSEQLYPLWCALWGFKVVINAYCTICIVYRIYQVDKNTSKLSDTQYDSERNTPPAVVTILSRKRSRVQGAIRIIVESGLILTTSSIIAFGVQIPKSSLIYITSAIDIIVTGIAFNLIIIRISEERARERMLRTMYLTSLRFEEKGNECQEAVHEVINAQARAVDSLETSSVETGFGASYSLQLDEVESRLERHNTR